MSIELRDLSKRFGDLVVVNRVDLEVHDGELLVLLGSSGSGKSTILRIIAGLTPPDSGTITLNGRDVTALPPQARGVGFVFQNYSNFRHMSAAQNIEFGLRIRNVPPEQRRLRSDELLELVGMAGLGARFPDQLSGGQQQRVAIARALAYEPAVLLLDEPFGALDVKIRSQLRASLRAVQRRLGVTTILVTHDQEEAFELADRIGVLERGRLIEAGTPEQLYYRPRTEYAATFIGGGNVLVGRAEAGAIRLGSARLPLRPQDPAHDEGAPARVMFRPESLELSPQPFQGQAGLHQLARGAVRERVFAGSLERVRLEVDGLQGARPLAPSPVYGERRTLLEAAAPADPGRRPAAPGEAVWIGVRDYHVLQPTGLHLLICFDPSPGGQAAAETGCTLALAANGPATLLGVAADQQQRERLEPLMRPFLTQAPSIEAQVRQGHAAVEILEALAEGTYEVVVVGRSRRIEHEPLRIGSTALRLLEASTTPILLVSHPVRSIRSVMICTAAGEPGKADVLFGGRLARRTGATVHVAYVAWPGAAGPDLTRAERHLAEAQASLELLGVPARTRLVRHAGVAEGILQAAEEQAADLLVIGAPAPFERPFLRGPDLALQIVRASTRPVLVVPMT